MLIATEMASSRHRSGCAISFSLPPPSLRLSHRASFLLAWASLDCLAFTRFRTLLDRTLIGHMEEATRNTLGARCMVGVAW